MDAQLRFPAEQRLLLKQTLNLFDKRGVIHHGRLADHLTRGFQRHLHQSRGNHAVQRVQGVLKLADQLLHAGMDRRMLSARLVLALLQPLTQAFLITLFVAFLSTFRQTRVITLLMGLQLQAHEQGYNAGLAEGRQKGHEQGYQDGLAQGLEQGQTQARAQHAPIHARMQQLVSEFQNTLDALDSVIASRLMQMALEAARQVIGQTPIVDNAALIKQIQQLLQQEPLFSGKPQLRVHPDDLQRVEEMLGATLSLHGWRLRGDPTLHHGGCKVSADEGDLDASVATRWQELCRLAAPGVV